MHPKHLMTNLNDTKKERPYGICPHCGEKYYTWAGSMAHNLKQCDKVAKRNEQ